MLNLTKLSVEALDVHLERTLEGGELVEEALRAKWAKFEQRVEEDRYVVYEDEDAEERDAFEDQAADEYHRLSTALPRLFRYSLFLAAYSSLEHFFTSICVHHERESDGPRLKDLRGEGIERAQLYLKKVACIEFPDTDPNWARLKEYGMLRNLISHRQGLVVGHEKETNVRSMQTRLKNFTIENDGGIVLGDQFLPDFAKTARDFSVLI